MSLSKRIGTLVMIVVMVFGTFCMFDLYRTLNIKNLVIGYFQTNTDVVQISDFEYDINALLFTNSGDNENTYFATATGKPVSNYDNTKSYTIAVNGIRANRVYGTANYVNANFTNTFYSTQDTILLTDTLNIKVNFYTEGTKIIFLTQNGETAVSLWNSYIQKNGFKLTIIEDNFTPTIQADNLPEYTVNLYVEDELYETKIINLLSDKTLPSYIGTKTVLNWKDSEDNIYLYMPLENINLYVEFKSDKIMFELNNSTITNIYPGLMWCDYHCNIRQLTSSSDIEVLNNLFRNTISKTGALKVLNFYGNDYIFNLNNLTLNNYFSRETYNYSSTSGWYKYSYNFEFWLTNEIKIMYDFYYNDETHDFEYSASISFVDTQQSLNSDTFNQFYTDSQNLNMSFNIVFEISL